MATEHVVAKTSDLNDGEMKEVQAGDFAVLLARVNGKFYAVGPKCNHYGAPLEDGVLCGHQVRCPWHQARFDVRTGDLTEPPALNALPRFDVRVDGDDVVVAVPEDAKGRRLMPMVKRDPSDDRTFVIVGAGAAGNAAAEALRQAGFTGRVVMVTREKHLPYDRPDLSKDYLAKKEHEFAPTLRSDKFYATHDIEILTEREVTRLDARAKVIEFVDGQALEYDKALIATGGRPRTLDIPGSDLGNIFTLRGLDDADRIAAAADKASKAVIIGASFIGMEAAAALTKRGLAVTVVAPESVPFERLLGKDIGQMMRQDHEANGVSFRLKQKVVRFSGDSEVDGVYLGTRELLQADLVVLGIGVQPVTNFVEGVDRNDDGSLSVDEHFQVIEDLYAAGDVARFVDRRTDQPVRIEHWRLAEQHGRIAAHNMAGNPTEYAGVPFFWSNQFKANIRYVGHASAWDEIIYDGDLAAKKFLAYYVKDSTILAVVGCGLPKQIGAAADLMRVGNLPTVEDLRGGSVDLLGRLKTCACRGAG
ncbi:MAG: FAD-dependent oxidoreductase [Phycisphaerae bacterium]|nr:FAD-dependent oxidoreductase [Phycisphaerae bacterium]